jgi:hypothetical protein
MSVTLRMWNILNVKSTDKDLRKRDDFCIPMRSVACDNMQHLVKIGQWLAKWDAKKLTARNGTLYAETMSALRHTISTLLDMISHLLSDMKFSYVLTGRFQLVMLEFRFGQYCQMSGLVYRVPVWQVKECEKKLKIVSLLHFISASKGK